MDNPNLKLIAQLGDANPFDYDGQFVFIDEMGSDTPFMEVLTLVSGDNENVYNEHEEIIEEGDMKWEIHVIQLEPCTYINGILSDNEFHPDHPVWFSDKIDAIAEFIGSKPEKLIEALCGDDIIERAQAYKSIADCYGIVNFDEHPIEFDMKKEIDAKEQLEERYNSHIELLNSN